MWKQNKLGGYEQTPTKQQRPRSGWAPHPKTGQTVWYDAKTDTYRGKFKGPARDALSIAWWLSGGKDAENIVRDSIKIGKKVIPIAYKADKASREAKGKMMDKTITDAKNLAKELLVSKTSPSLTAKDATGITEDLEAKIEDRKILDRESAAKPGKVENTANNSKKKNQDLLIKKKTDPFADVGYE